MSKKRILFASEFTPLSSGFSKYYRELMTRIHNSGKYVIAEFAQYCAPEDPRMNNIPWIVYPNLPYADNQQEQQVYNASHLNQFGQWRIDEVILDFKPDVVVDLRDLWMASIIFNSPLRKFYNIAYISCVDSVPIRNEWLAEINDADAIFGYVDWTLDVIREQSKLAKCKVGTPPGANFDIFKPVADKVEHKTKSGINPDSIIFGMVGRNQKRKLYPDLCIGFKQAVEKVKETNPEVADKMLLYIHSSMPDAAYDFGRLLFEHGLSRKAIFTYICHNCKQTFVSFYQDARTFCPKCNQYAAQMPNVGMGVDENVLAEIYNMMDCYIQYATNEGAGMPQIEAGACGVPTMAVDHTAMGDIVRKLKGTPIKVKQLFREVETGADKCVPDNDHLAEEIAKFALLSDNERKKKATLARVGALTHFDYQKSAQRLMDYFDSVDLDINRWNAAPNLKEPVLDLTGVRHEQFVDWIICNVLGEPERLGSHFASMLHRQFNMGYRETSGTNYHMVDESCFGNRSIIQPVNPEQMINDLKAIAERRLYWEKRRVGLEKVPMPRYIQEAHNRIKQ